MEFTGERVIPACIECTDLYADHFARYCFAATYTKDKTVLDLGCGCGYGAEYLVKNGAKKVVGIDISQEAVQYAKTKYCNNALEFIAMDCTKLKFSDNTYDAVVSFETIEHVQDTEVYLAEIKRVLKNGGFFITSTPNKKNMTQTCNNKFHVKEYRLDEFTGLLKKYFAINQMLGQRYTNTFLCNLKTQELLWRNLHYLNTQVQSLSHQMALLRQNPLYRFMPAWITTIIPNYIKQLFRPKLKTENKGFLITPYPALVKNSGDIEITDDNINDSIYFIAVCKKTP